MGGRERRFRDWGRARHAAFFVLAAAAAGGAGAAVLAKTGWAIGPSLFSLAPPCLFHLLTGLYCPGCGSTRAFYHLARGEALAAVGSNPLLVVALPFLLAAVLETRTAGSKRAGLRCVVYSPHIGWGLAVVTILFTILRNLPFRSFRWLAP